MASTPVATTPAVPMTPSTIPSLQQITETSAMAKAEVDRFRQLLERERVAFDIGSYRAAPPGLRIWCGATVEADDLKALTRWMEWAYARVTVSGTGYE